MKIIICIIIQSRLLDSTHYLSLQRENFASEKSELAPILFKSSWCQITPEKLHNAGLFVCLQNIELAFRFFYPSCRQFLPRYEVIWIHLGTVDGGIVVKKKIQEFFISQGREGGRQIIIARKLLLFLCLHLFNCVYVPKEMKLALGIFATAEIFLQFRRRSLARNKTFTYIHSTMQKTFHFDANRDKRSK